MTPIDRARGIGEVHNLLCSMITDGRISPNHARKVDSDVATAIRAAENDALERAALNLDQEVRQLENGGADAAVESICFRDAAKIVRALKHKELV